MSSSESDHNPFANSHMDSFPFLMINGKKYTEEGYSEIGEERSGATDLNFRPN